MCIFAAPSPTPFAAPPAIEPRQDTDTTLPGKKDVVDPGQVNIIVLTHETQEKKVQVVLEGLKTADNIVSEPQLIRFA